MKRKNLFIIGAIVPMVMAGAVMASKTPVGQSFLSNIRKAGSSESAYALSLGSSATITGSKINVSTTSGNPVEFDVSGVTSQSGALGSFAAGATIKNTNAILGTSKVTVVPATDATFILEYGWDDSCNHTSVRLNKLNNYSYELLSKPSYIKITAESAVVVNSLNINYSCSATSEARVLSSHSNRVATAAQDNGGLQIYNGDYTGARRLGVGETFVTATNIYDENVWTDEDNGSYLSDPTFGNNAHSDLSLRTVYYGCKASAAAGATHEKLLEVTVVSWDNMKNIKLSGSIMPSNVEKQVSERTITSLNKAEGLTLYLEKVAKANNKCELKVYTLTADNYLEYVVSSGEIEDFDVRFIDGCHVVAGLSSENKHDTTFKSCKVYENKKVMEVAPVSAKHMISGKDNEQINGTNRSYGTQNFAHGDKGMVDGDFTLEVRGKNVAATDETTYNTSMCLQYWTNNSNYNIQINLLRWSNGWYLKFQSTALKDSSQPSQVSDYRFSEAEYDDIANGNVVITLERVGKKHSLYVTDSIQDKHLVAYYYSTAIGGVQWGDTKWWDTVSAMSKCYAPQFTCNNLF